VWKVYFSDFTGGIHTDLRILPVDFTSGIQGEAFVDLRRRERERTSKNEGLGGRKGGERESACERERKREKEREREREERTSKNEGLGGRPRDAEGVRERWLQRQVRRLERESARARERESV